MPVENANISQQDMQLAAAQEFAAKGVAIEKQNKAVTRGTLDRRINEAIKTKLNSKLKGKTVVFAKNASRQGVVSEAKSEVDLVNDMTKDVHNACTFVRYWSEDSHRMLEKNNHDTIKENVPLLEGHYCRRDNFQYGEGQGKGTAKPDGKELGRRTDVTIRHLAQKLAANIETLDNNVDNPLCAKNIDAMRTDIREAANVPIYGDTFKSTMIETVGRDRLNHFMGDKTFSIENSVEDARFASFKRQVDEINATLQRDNGSNLRAYAMHANVLDKGANSNQFTVLIAETGHNPFAGDYVARINNVENGKDVLNSMNNFNDFVKDSHKVAFEKAKKLVNSDLKMMDKIDTVQRRANYSEMKLANDNQQTRPTAQVNGLKVQQQQRVQEKDGRGM